MTPHDAAVLAAFVRHRRRLLPPITRVLLGRPIEDDAMLPPRRAEDSMAVWLVRIVESARAPARKSRPLDASALDAAARRSLYRAARAGVDAVALGGASYPAALAEIADPPPVLWCRGHAADLSRPGLAVVGCRAASSHGLAMARRLARDLAAAGLVIVSGLARGIDAAAHEGALAAGGRTVAVLGSGHDRLYPPEHAELASRIEASGAIVSELPPGTPALAHHFPMRNRIVSGLVLGVVIVEAPEKSGALITAGCALEQGRDVFVVPGPVLGERNRGGHGLLRDGAKLVESADDILRDVAGGWGVGRSGGLSDGKSDESPWLSQTTEGIEFSVDEVARVTGAPSADVLAGLLELEMAGRVRRVGGGRFVRSPGRVLT